MSNSTVSQNVVDVQSHLPGAYIASPTPSVEENEIHSIASQDEAPPSKQSTKAPAAGPIKKRRTNISLAPGEQRRSSERIKKAKEKATAAKDRADAEESAQRIDKKNNSPAKKVKKGSQKSDPESDNDMKHANAARGRTRAKAPEPEDINGNKPSEEEAKNESNNNSSGQTSVGITKMRKKMNSLLDMSFDVADSFSEFVSEHHPGSNASVKVKEHMEGLCEKYGRKRKLVDDEDTKNEVCKVPEPEPEPEQKNREILPSEAAHN